MSFWRGRKMVELSRKRRAAITQNDVATLNSKNKVKRCDEYEHNSSISSDEIILESQDNISSYCSSDPFNLSVLPFPIKSSLVSKDFEFSPKKSTAVSTLQLSESSYSPTRTSNSSFGSCQNRIQLFNYHKPSRSSFQSEGSSEVFPADPSFAMNYKLPSNQKVTEWIDHAEQLGSTSRNSKVSKSRRNEAQRQDFNLKKYSLLPPCTDGCKKNCRSIFNEESREIIREEFWKRDFRGRREFMKNTITILPTKRSRGTGLINRNNSLIYSFSNSLGEKVVVCREMYLATLGMRNNGFIKSFTKWVKENPLSSPQEKRGKAVKHSNEEKEKIIQHINSFHPQLSHYNNQHAPNRRYLESHLSIRYLWKDYVSHSGNAKISYSFYQTIFHSQNIGFSRPCQDECDICQLFNSHSHNSEEDESLCKICSSSNEHLANARVAREAYQADRDKVVPENHISMAVDMQKVILLPKTNLKSQYFISRMTVFNETFCDLKSKKDICVLWHEAETGRCAADVASAYVKVMTLMSQYSSFCFWADNCCAQNKNWTLISALWLFVNQPHGPDAIEIKFLEKGHTFMRPDSVHGAIGNKFKKSDAVHDWNDLEKLISSASSHIQISSLTHADVYRFEDLNLKSLKTLPKLKDLKAIMVKRSSTKMHFKFHHYEANYREKEFLHLKYREMDPIHFFPTRLEKARGMNKKKKEEITKILVPHMTSRKSKFWSELPTDDVCDLVGQRDPAEEN